MMTKKYCLQLHLATTDILGRIFDAAKYCLENSFTPQDIHISETTYKSLAYHPQVKGRVSDIECFPPQLTIYGFTFIVNFDKVDSGFDVEIDVPVKLGDALLKNVVIFEVRNWYR